MTEQQMRQLSDRLYDNGWYTTAHFILECKDEEECREHIINHCGKEWLFLMDNLNGIKLPKYGKKIKKNT